MRKILTAAAGMLALGLFGQALAQTPEERLKREEEKLAGTWRVTAAKANGERLPDREVPDLKLTFKDGKYTVQFGKEKPQEGTYKIDPAKNPKTIDINRTTGPEQGKKQVGIYELTGNELKICACDASKDRPANFDTRDKPGYSVLVLKRVPR
jgi:uncharacterized protein (TIGR03067 family)